ncbi:MAG: 4Fe-4S dicluster domain-containing protein [Lentisphaerota bacterium]
MTKQISIAVDLNRCIGCKTCIIACRNNHSLVDHTKAKPDEIPYYLRVEKKLEGNFPKLKETCYVVPCQQCKDPECIKACKFKAITKDIETGIVFINPDKCIGCKMCVKKCPYQVIQYNKEKKKAHKCDFCYERTLGGDKPVCVETCMTDALRYGDKELIIQQLTDAGKKIDAALSKESVIYFR